MFNDMYAMKMNAINNKRRENLLTQALTFSTPEEQIKFVVDYFLNNLSPETIAQIDEVSNGTIVPFIYDYSNLENVQSETDRKKQTRACYNLYGESIGPKDVDNRKKEQIQIYPTLYSLKMGTCIMFASEIQRFSYDFGIESKLVREFTPCYDHFEGKGTCSETIKTDQIINMYHAYNVITIDKKDYKIDISSILTARDYNNYHPTTPINENLFYFSEDIHRKPFEEHMDTCNNSTFQPKQNGE